MRLLEYTGPVAPVEIGGHIFAPATNPHALEDDAALAVLAVASDVLHDVTQDAAVPAPAPTPIAEEEHADGG